MRNTLLSQIVKKHAILSLGGLILAAGVIFILLLPDLAQRLLQYYLNAFGKVKSHVLAFGLIQISLGLAVLILEVVVVGWKKSSLRQFLYPDKSAITDLCIFFINTLQIDYILMFILTAGLLHKLKLGLKAAVGLNEGLLASHLSSPALQLAIYIVVADFMIYLAHYLHHRLGFLWAFHSYHHSATELNVITANRGHPVQSELTNGLVTFIPLTLLGFPLVAFMAFRIIRTTVTFMHHSRLPWGWGKFGQYVVVSPAFHRVHHSVLPEHHDKNLAVLFPVWDHLFGTYYKGNAPALEMGLPESPYHRKSFAYDLTVPFRMLKSKDEKS